MNSNCTAQLYWCPPAVRSPAHRVAVMLALLGSYIRFRSLEIVHNSEVSSRTLSHLLF
ncbi:hypothetical protein GQ55_4G351300 [Panicum hallii var. hallii]|uniref:Uncharacterized protein n=2 Tax=Panicum hallii TaxID=206008 RepID=A0A2T7E3G6_9POAL|nr:hypothetical protein PAHAL_4G340200 [Panicum hallii]PUZ62364.1 hypothetical protein GQ55_4G351300 [Panicum hallii var. hallii]